MENENAGVSETKGGFPWATAVLAAAILFFFWREIQAIQYGIIDIMFRDFAFRWTRFAERPLDHIPTLFSHVLMHAGVDHIRGNLLFFIVFAPAVERRFGGLAFFLLFWVWGIAAALSQGFFTPFSPGMVGASGAISGVMGAFFVLYPLRFPVRWLSSLGAWAREQKKLLAVRREGAIQPFGSVLFSFSMDVLNVLCQVIARIPAFVYVGAWFLLQLKAGFASVIPQLSGRVTFIAHWAHIGGFAAGALSVLPFLTRKNEEDSPGR